MATIIDVAAEAGVSFKTVSRVLNGEANVRDSTRKKVLDAVEALDYRVNAAARNLRAKETGLVALVFDNPSRAYAHDLQIGTMQGCQSAGLALSIQNDFSIPALSELGTRSDCLGYIVGAPQADDPGIIEALLSSGKPLLRIATEKPIAGSHHISVDEFQAAFEATQHLVNLGHSRIAFIGGPEQSDSAQRRREGYLQALAAASLAAKPNWAEPGEYDFKSGLRIATDYLTQDMRPTAIFACNDDMAAGALAAAYKLGIRVPDELSIVGFDDSPVASVVYPSLTTVRQTTSDMAKRAVQWLVDLHRGAAGETTHIAVPHTLIVRGSTAIL